MLPVLPDSGHLSMYESSTKESNILLLLLQLVVACTPWPRPFMGGPAALLIRPTKQQRVASEGQYLWHLMLQLPEFQRQFAQVLWSLLSFNFGAVAVSPDGGPCNVDVMHLVC